MRVIYCALLFLLLAAGVNLVVDPLGMFFVADLPGVNRYKPEILNYWRTSLGLRARLLRPEVVILGSSRALVGINPADPAFRGRKVFNMGMPGATLCDIRDAFEIALAGGRLKQAVIGLDFFSANAARIGSDCGLPEEKYHPWRLLVQTLFSSDTLNASLKTVTKQSRVDPAIWQPAPDGHALLDPGFTAKKGGVRLMFAEMEGIYARDYFLPPPACAFLTRRADTGASLDYLRQLLAVAHARKVEVRLFFSPEHARMLGVMDAAGLMPAFEEWMRGVLQANQETAAAAGEPAFPISTHFEPAWVGEALPPAGQTATGMQWFLDGSHYTPAAGRAIIARVMGMPADPDVTLEMSRLRAAADGYFNTHPEERAQAESAVAQARRGCRG
jgi:hypothetical protein